MRRLKGWEDSTFDLILHAETCYRKGEDFDRRIALILFDNSIETAIITHLTVHPDQRKNVIYTNADVDTWSRNFHTKLDFLFKFIADNACTVSFERADLIHCHEIRNGQYHGGTATIPRARDLDDIRNAALEIFAILFDFPDAADLLEIRIAELDPMKDFPKKNDDDDKLIDDKLGMIKIAGRLYYASDVLHSVEPVTYGNIAANIKAGIEPDEDEIAE